MSDDTRYFRSSNGVMISFTEIVGGGREGVLKSLRDDLAVAEADITEWTAELSNVRQRLEEWELELARARARHDALTLAIASAEKAFS